MQIFLVQLFEIFFVFLFCEDQFITSDFDNGFVISHLNYSYFWILSSYVKFFGQLLLLIALSTLIW